MTGDATPPSPDAMAAIHAAAFTRQRPWAAVEFRALLDTPGTRAFALDDGFALTRTIAGEAELLTIAVAPHARRNGLGRRLLQLAMDAARADGAKEMFLEVDAANTAALALYAAAGFTETGRRADYYVVPGGGRADAVVMRAGLTD